MPTDEVRFDDRVILVTGGGRGMGRTHALLLASRGAKVVIADSGVATNGADANSAVADAVVEEIKSAGGEAVACAVDLATEDGSNQAVQTCIDAFGRIDGLLHNASTVPTSTTADKLPSHDFDLVMRVNVYAGFWLTRAAWPHMVERGYGRIMYTTSGAIWGTAGASAYSAAKSAYIGLMRAFAVEGAPRGIYVNVLGPSARTRMTEQSRPSPYMEWLLKTMLPEKISIGAAYLMSEACNFYGEILSFEGGHISHITLAENEGFFGPGESIEEVRDNVQSVLTDTSYFYPKDLSERTVYVANLFGLDESMGAKDAWKGIG